MKQWRDLPLGVDLGSSRARIAFAQRDREGHARVSAVISRELPEGEELDLTAALLEEMIAELGVRERRCVMALGVPEACVRSLRFPRMSSLERRRAATFEAARFSGWEIDTEPSTVRVHPLDAQTGLFAVGVAKNAALMQRCKIAKMARLNVVAIDQDAFALRRSFSNCDAILDIGLARTALHVYAPSGLRSWSIEGGGADITQGIARDLSIDRLVAEKRKRVLGTAGAGTQACRDLLAAIASGVERARSTAVISRIAVTGNGARLPGLLVPLEAATSANIEMPVGDALHGDAYPEDVVRAAAPDWNLAAALATWSAAK